MMLKTFNYTKEDKKVLKKLCKKYLQDIELTSNNVVRGLVDIKNIRFYDNYIRIHIVLKGEVCGRINRVSEWHQSSALKKRNISKIKIYRQIRRHTLTDLRNSLLKLGVQTDYHNLEIYKVEWV